MDILSRIKRLIVRDQYLFTRKAGDELDADGLTEDDAVESILNAKSIKKTIRSTSPQRRHAGKKLYIIEGRNYSGTSIYTKGKIDEEEGKPYFYIVISSKRSTFSG